MTLSIGHRFDASCTVVGKADAGTIALRQRSNPMTAAVIGISRGVSDGVAIVVWRQIDDGLGETIGTVILIGNDRLYDAVTGGTNLGCIVATIYNL